MIEQLPNEAVVLIAAMPGELQPMTRTWASAASKNGVEAAQHPSNTIFALHGGMGAAAATRAFARAFELCRPTAIYSCGWAGALDPELDVGAVLRADAVRDLATGESYTCAPTAYRTHGLLLTARRVANQAEKQRLHRTYTGVHAVDMEAATLARLAGAHGLPFRAVKAISDSFEELLPDMNPFITQEGRFATGRMVAYAAIRPSLWPVLSRFGRQAKLAASNLCDSLAGELGIEKPAP